jgi:hypothetical protein
LILRDIGGDSLQHPIDLGRSPLVESGKPQDALLPDPELINIMRLNLCLDGELIALWNNEHERFAGGDHSANGMD